MSPTDERPPPADPDDLKASLVYADWLQSRGDPRGELITVQHARRMADSPALAKREEQLLSSLGATFFGPLAPLLETGEVAVSWQLGFLKKIRVGREGYESRLDVASTLRQLLALPLAQHVREIAVGLCEFTDGDEVDLQPAIDLLLELKPPTVTKLVLGDFEFPDQIDLSMANVGDCTGLSAAYPQLESLRLQGREVTLGAIELPELRDFTFVTGGLGAMEEIAAARWPKLERLELWFGDEQYGCTADLDGLAPILAGGGVGQLRHLGLVNCGLLTGNVEVLARAKIMPQLETLDLSLGTFGDEEAEVFAQHARSFRHLTSLKVNLCCLTRRGLYLLQKVVPVIESVDQKHTVGAQGRYVSVGE